MKIEKGDVMVFSVPYSFKPERLAGLKRQLDFFSNSLQLHYLGFPVPFLILQDGIKMEAIDKQELAKMLEEQSE